MKPFLSLALTLGFASSVFSADVKGWLSWRGPLSTGVSLETGLPSDLDPQAPLWTADYPGASTPAIANGKLYVVGFLGAGSDLQEGVSCFDAESGELLWRKEYNDFLSDIIYNRYATSSPAIDPETGNVYIQGTQGVLMGFSPDGEELWKVSMMENYGRLTFPNGRTATPVVDRDLVITRGITANWGANGPGGDRFYAFDKSNGDLVWASTPADRPKDSSFSYPYLGWFQGKRVFFATTGDGSVVCANARTGDPIWRIPMAKAGINASVLVHNNDKVVAIYGTPYEPGQMVALRIPRNLPEDAPSPAVIERAEAEIWSLDISTSTSSPILVGDRVFVVAEKGDLHSVNVEDGSLVWSVKIGIEQRNASPLFADGKLYVPMLEDPDKTAEAGTTGAFYVIDPSDEGRGEILDKAVLQGRVFGSPAVYNGKVYIQTTDKLYCFGRKGNNPGLPKETAPEKWPAAGQAAQLQIIPSEVLLQPGEKESFRIRKLDKDGFLVEEIKDVSQVKWASYIPPTARVKTSMNGSFNDAGQLVADETNKPSAGAFEATLNGLKGYIRGRVLPGAPFEEDFESFALDETNSAGQAFAYPPLPWIGARFKFEVQERDGSKALAKTIDNIFFQRATVFIGEPSMSNYTIQADVMSDGTRRKMSDVGLINQRYYILLKGNEQKLEVNSNLERFRFPSASERSIFRWAANEWYTLKARVDTDENGKGVIRAKAWKRGEPEPEEWTLEAPHEMAHQNGSPGLFGFSPQKMPVYIDNVTVTPND